MREIVQENRTTILLEKMGFVSRKDGRQGWPDRCVYVGASIHIWVEHKTDRGRLTPAQKRIFPKLEKMGDVVIYGKGKTADEIAITVFETARALKGFA